jgi:4-amino-4-deoxy-L-arabinose transferase-like glycosyltransferase
MVLPVLGFPWLFWPTLWPRLLRRPGLVEPARRLLTAWLLPTFVVFCLISAKQVYYLVPLMPAAALALARDLDGGAGVNPQARVPWTLLPFALALAATGAIVLLLSYGVSFGYAFNHWVGELSHANPALGAALIVLALTLVLPARERGLALAPRLATITLLATVAGHALFTASLWHYFDLEPVARIIAAGQRAGHQVATSYKYEGEYHFFGRLTEPLLELNDRDLPAWAAAHPDGVLVTRPSGHAPRIEAKPMFEAEFRERRVQIWRAADWLAAEQ